MSIQTQNNSRVLGIDPGFDRVGVAVLEGSSSKQTLLFSECIQTSAKDVHEKRLEIVGKRIREVIETWKPNSLSIEKLFFGQNTTSAIKVAEARGVILYEAACAGLEVHEYTPQEIKIAATGYGKAAKSEVETMTLRLLNIKTKPMLDDEIDAIAVGITHLASSTYKKKISPKR
jgi:crossover junction endodeoxyribonuclease RuvC